MATVFIIAEAGVNHNGSIDIAKSLIDSAVECMADAVKFQTFRAEKIIIKTAPKAEYQKKSVGIEESQFDMLKKLELSQEIHRELIEYCKKKNIMFLSTPFDIESIEFLATLELGIFKIPSGEITNLPYLRKIGALRKKILLSTGMSDIGEIEDALDILISSGTSKNDITVLHCNTEYPTPFEDTNLYAIHTIRDAFKVKVGYSDHTLGIEVPIAAVALGAVVIEKHFTIDKRLEGPDHKVSIEPDEFRTMVLAIRNLEKAIGNGIKKATPSEMKNKDIVRKSIVAARDIKAGEFFSEDNMIVKRPGNGISPMEWDNMLKRKALRNFNKDELIDIFL